MDLEVAEPLVYQLSTLDRLPPFQGASRKTPLSSSSTLPRNKESSHLCPLMPRSCDNHLATITFRQFTFKNYSSLPLDNREYLAHSRHNFAALHKSSYVHMARVSKYLRSHSLIFSKPSQQLQQARTLDSAVLSNSTKSSDLPAHTTSAHKMCIVVRVTNRCGHTNDHVQMLCQTGKPQSPLVHGTTSEDRTNASNGATTSSTLYLDASRVVHLNNSHFKNSPSSALR
jgi:hypothetical protein